MKTTTYHSDGSVTVSDKPIPTALDMTRASLMIAVSAYDHVHNSKPSMINRGHYTNPRDIAADLDAVDKAIELVRCGCTLKFAIIASFSGSLKLHLIGRLNRR